MLIGSFQVKGTVPSVKGDQRRTASFLRILVAAECAEGASSRVPGVGQRSNKETANDLAALHARIAPHRRNQAPPSRPGVLKAHSAIELWRGHTTGQSRCSNAHPLLQPTQASPYCLHR